MGIVLECGLVLFVIIRDGDGCYESFGWCVSGVYR